MSYIGVPPVSGDFIVLDNITASATASYTLQRNSANFVPESANHMLVSLNGSIQKPNSSFTISGSTITFSSTLASSDSIDFILVLGNVNAVGVATTVSDNAITNAKTDFVSTSSGAGLQIKGDGTTDGTLQLNCSQNSHGVKIKSPAHSASASYTLTLPTTDGSADEFLKTDGSGVLSWATAGGTNTPLFQAKLSSNTNISDATVTLIPANTEELDTGGCYNNTGSTVTLNGISTPAYAFAPNVAGKYYIEAQSTGYGGSTSGLTTISTWIYKNGSQVKSNGINLTSNAGYVMSSDVAVIVSMNGTSDYVQAYSYIDGNSEARLQAGDFCTIGGYRLIE